VTLRILFVCHANMCRSPMAERVARHCLATADVVLSSAGTHARDGLPMHPFAAEALTAVHVDHSGFASRRLTAVQLAGSDIVLAGSRTERASCARLAPAAIGRMFTIRQFSRLAGTATRLEPAPGAGAAPGERLLTAVRRARALTQPANPEDDDLADPIGRPAEQFHACRDALQELLIPINTLLASTADPLPSRSRGHDFSRPA